MQSANNEKKNSLAKGAVFMFLNERKIKILDAIINDYIHTAEPIGSRTIAKKYDLGISSATIRNEMSDLEDMGFIIQPHASAGRVPSDKGYRLYVDRLKPYRELTKDETAYLRQTVHDNISQMDFLMKETAKAISLLTNCTAIISEPHISKTLVKHIQLAPLDEKSIVLLLITDSNVVKNQIVQVGEFLDYQTLLNLTAIINANLQGLSIEEIDSNLVQHIQNSCGVMGKHILPIVKSIQSTVRHEDDLQVYTSGVKNILGFPEFSDLDKARALFQTLEEKTMLINLLGEPEDNKIQITIGDENQLQEMKGCSIIKTAYVLGDKAHGAVGLIGPTRMDYLEVTSVLNGIVKNINAAIEALTDG